MRVATPVDTKQRKCLVHLNHLDYLAKHLKELENRFPFVLSLAPFLKDPKEETQASR
jgi:hypothetical protein